MLARVSIDGHHGGRSTNGLDQAKRVCVAIKIRRELLMIHSVQNGQRGGGWVRLALALKALEKQKHGHLECCHP